MPTCKYGVALGSELNSSTGHLGDLGNAYEPHIRVSLFFSGMSWFDTSNFTSLAKTALSQAQKSIDKVLDIEQDGEGDGTSSVAVKGKPSSSFMET